MNLARKLVTAGVRGWEIWREKRQFQESVEMLPVGINDTRRNRGQLRPEVCGPRAAGSHKKADEEEFSGSAIQGQR